MEADEPDWHLRPTVVEPMSDFQNPKQEWRRLSSELLGTFFLVLVAAGRRHDG
jgi:aquaporin Z